MKIKPDIDVTYLRRDLVWCFTDNAMEANGEDRVMGFNVGKRSRQVQ